MGCGAAGTEVTEVRGAEGEDVGEDSEEELRGTVALPMLRQISPIPEHGAEVIGL